MGGNKLRKLEFLVWPTRCEGADTLITFHRGDSVEPCPSDGGGRGQVGLHCVALLEKSIGTTAEVPDEWYRCYWLFNTQIEMCDALTDRRCAAANADDAH